MSDLADSARAIQQFAQGNLTARIAAFESSLVSADSDTLRAYLASNSVTHDLLASAYLLKRAAGRINDIVHAVGILLLLPHLLEPNERIEYLSLAAGNTGKDYDLETTHRIAEFKFIDWQGGAEVIRQNSLFKDFYLLAESGSNKMKFLYVLGTEYPLKFLQGGRSLDSVMSRNTKLSAQFKERYGNRFKTVGDYFAFRQGEVIVEDICPLLKSMETND